MSQTILIVDDSAFTRCALGNALAEGGFETKASPNGQDAYDRIANGLCPDLILADVQMPIMSGIMLVDQLRHGEFNIPIILISGDHGGKIPNVQYLIDRGHVKKILGKTDLRLTIVEEVQAALRS